MELFQIKLKMVDNNYEIFLEWMVTLMIERVKTTICQKVFENQI